VTVDDSKYLGPNSVAMLRSKSIFEPQWICFFELNQMCAANSTLEKGDRCELLSG
jgi:hypothetical protein